MLQRIFLSVVALSFLVGGVVLADDEHPIAKSAKEKLKDPSKPFTLGVRFKVKEGMGAKLEEAFLGAVKATKKEKGCLAYDLNKSTDDETMYVLYERWASLADLDAHLKAPNTEKLLSTIRELLAGEPDKRVFLPVGD